MSCKSALYAANTASQTVAVGGAINFGAPIRRYGNNINVAGSSIRLNGAGYYDVDLNVTFTAGAGTTTIALYKDGVVVPGATASFTTVADTTYQVTIPAIVRDTCCAESNLAAVVSGTALIISNAAVAVEKI